MLPFVSVVIPVYNGQRYLRQALESVFAQTHRNIELIAVNDGSTDDSAEILASYEGRLVVVSQTNSGVGAARTAGMQAARGELVAFLDQDDWWLPEKIEKQVALFAADQRLGLVHTGVEHHDDLAGKSVGPLNPLAEPQLLVGDCYQRLLLDNQIYNSSVMVRAAVLKQVGYCNPAIRGNTVQDYDLWLRIAQVSRLGYVPEKLTVFRVHPNQGTWDRRQMLTEESRLLHRALDGSSLVQDAAMRARMAKLYTDLGTAHLDAGQRTLARVNYASSLGWRRTRRTAMLWTISWLPLGVIRAIQAARQRRAAPRDVT
jgi:glycosyltransferase involved in cell wall biosynthesis